MGLMWVCVHAHRPDNTALYALWTSNSEPSMIDWISDTLSQGHTNLQSLVKFLDHRGIASDTVCSQQ